ncbi:MAG TPA: cobyrinate a,c-diamide synthase [Bosea sp. (in: a-proteobacteria)]|jgi:cobyrinic acid a,c-diamide synthase|uniref:cobyrinate a,c-diamide synthase n=1 Tax=Bosea sp. (in: a-proteobacteria) TaxID=1871050 RepID=UPI002DDDABC8|nr:cobyrinate a,c-diamide synthase [Bosea sp. (in: a-proteobacteria)]HEV2552309.1 cobyrinate a,c-diamide synthase [Bosea sp. (in: a-proteobacteria)]
MTTPGLIIAAPRSGSGKTTITLGLQRALTRRGLVVRGLKCGPDYIDPAFHAAATGAPSANLDSFAMPDALLRAIAGDAADGADLVIAEGSMGLFDAVPGPEGHTGASADIAALLGWPIVLVIDVSGQAQSAAAIALGCMKYDPRITIAGVILNKVASERHRRLVAQGMEKIGLLVLGSLPREASLILPERHLGLVQAGETADLEARLEALADAVTAAIDLDAVRGVAQPTRLPAISAAISGLPTPGRRIAIARDAAFSFVYPHVEAGWRAAGAVLVPFSPLADEPPHGDCDACWLPGGYPELHAGAIAGADRFLGGLRAFAETRPVHGECGGYMVLGRTLIDADGVCHAMAGLLSVETSFAKRKMNLGYRRAILEADAPLGAAGDALTGHEFHYATIVTQGEDPPLALVTDPHGSAPSPAGSRRGYVTGSFFHAIAVAG